mmetsp:Transcript_10408/g.15762  ORF Transcript_10408/g.15762 Transcript_10408/m.15762 type:complete len:198 (+) Transcript_10408:196-789(+)|eukprot:CAMPEP_0194086366 /NCGR_PEP_ID=MMETSP0149-20130528/20891_1 /TAXON_ID=122233 /ORGANISM="Chaetoceros debilis, Strain MM31A-1" /LENGTH=197 /DNA_ID=CAMNT_0038769445 /DNA_START=132 /DNA_END=725 /DNA_ORIENTATION=-
MASFLQNIVRSSSNPIKKGHIVRKIVATPPEHLFSIINDVDAYQKFLPFCKSSKILRKSSCETQFDASLRVGLSDLPPLDAVEEEYISRVKVEKKNDKGCKEWIVEAKSIRSTLFHGLSSKWSLREVEDPNMPYTKCAEATLKPWTRVEFEVEMTVSDPILATALDKVLESVANQQIEAFEKRCHQTPITISIPPSH